MQPFDYAHLTVSYVGKGHQSAPLWRRKITKKNQCAKICRLAALKFAKGHVMSDFICNFAAELSTDDCDSVGF